MLSEGNQSQEDHIVSDSMYGIYETSRTGRSRQTESRPVVAGARRRESGGSCLIGTGLLLGR